MAHFRLTSDNPMHERDRKSPLDIYRATYLIHFQSMRYSLSWQKFRRTVSMPFFNALFYSNSNAVFQCRLPMPSSNVLSRHNFNMTHFRLTSDDPMHERDRESPLDIFKLI